MNKCSLALKSAVVCGIPIVASGVAFGQTAGSYSEPQLTVGFPNEFNRPAAAIPSMKGSGIMFQRYRDRQMWNTILIISAVVGVVGILNDDGGLIIIGAAGVIVSLTQMNDWDRRLNMFDRGVDLARTGPVALGIDPAGMLAEGPRTAFNQPGLYLKASFRF